MNQLKGKIAVITGGSSGIGLAIASRFVHEGAYVFIVGRRQSALDDAVALIGGGVEGIHADVTDAEDLDRAFQSVRSAKGGVDTLVISSGVSEPSKLDQTTQTYFDKTFDTNVRATLFTVQKALPLMVHGGTVVLIGSVASSIGTPGFGTYNASKAATRSFARTWTAELQSRGIRVNTLSPGPIVTPMWHAAGEEMQKLLTARIPLGRPGKPQEVAAAALFLASEESSYIAGADICVDGGMTQV